MEFRKIYDKTEQLCEEFLTPEPKKLNISSYLGYFVVMGACMFLLFSFDFGYTRVKTFYMNAVEASNYIVSDFLKEEELISFDSNGFPLAKRIEMVGLDDLKVEVIPLGEQEDYLNVACFDFTSNLKVDKRVAYEVNQVEDELFVDLKIDYALRDERGALDGVHKIYTIVKMPKGVEMLSIEGVDTAKSYEEEKKVLELFSSIDAREILHINLNYKLPERVSEYALSKFYVLNVESDETARGDILSVSLNFDRSIKKYEPLGFYVKTTENNSVNWESDLISDKKFKVLLNE